MTELCNEFRNVRLKTKLLPINVRYFTQNDQPIDIRYLLP